MTVQDEGIDHPAILAFWRLLAMGNAAVSPRNSRSLGVLFRRIGNPDREPNFFRFRPTDSISLLSVDALDSLLSEGGLAIESEEMFLESILSLGEEYFPPIRHVRWHLMDSD
jgi:hypothetical protein